MNAPLLPGRIEHWPLGRLRPYARNAKTHDANQVAKIAASMAEFGWTVPVLVAADGELIAGHGRILAAAQLGLQVVLEDYVHNSLLALAVQTTVKFIAVLGAIVSVFAVARIALGN